jgi:hypothetical protein
MDEGRWRFLTNKGDAKSPNCQIAKMPGVGGQMIRHSKATHRRSFCIFVPNPTNTFVECFTE